MAGKTANIRTKEDFLNASIKDISSVYNGKRDCCRCGCRGTYTTTTFANHDRSDANDVLIEKRLSRAKKMILAGAEFDLIQGCCLDLKTGEDRTLTFYFDDLK